MLKLKSLLSQLCAIFPYLCLRFASGTITGIHTILIAELHKENSEIPASIEELSWFASIDVVGLVGSLITGSLIHRLGTRSIALIIAILHLSSCLLYHYSTSATTVLISQTLISILVMDPLIHPYVSEVSEPRFRSTFLVFVGLSNDGGLFFSLLLNTHFYWRTIAIVVLIFPILTLVTVLLTPKSPLWLASKGRLDEAEKSLCWLRGWVEKNEVEVEFRALVDNAQKSTTNLEDSKVKSSKHLLQHFRQRSFYLPLGTMCLILFVFSLGSALTTRRYAAVILHEIHSPIEESVATAIVGASGIMGHLILLSFIRRVGKRKLALATVVITGLSFAAIATVGFLKLQGDYLFIPAIALIVANIADASGIGPIVYMLNSEIFPSSVRYIGSSIGYAVSIIATAIVRKLFLYAVEAITLYGVFLGFAIMNVVTLITFYFLMPETEGRSLTEIEDQFDRVEKLDECEK